MRNECFPGYVDDHCKRLERLSQEIADIEGTPAEGGRSPSLSQINLSGRDLKNVRQIQLPETTEKLRLKIIQKKSRRKKAATCLEMNVDEAIKKFPMNQLYFFTLTLKQHLDFYRQKDSRLAQKIFLRWRKHFFNPRGWQWIRVVEPQKSGRIHYHVIVVSRETYHSQFDWDQFNKNCSVPADADWSNFDPRLRRLWSEIRTFSDRCPYSGRTEFVPVKSDFSAGRYLGKYLTKLDSILVPFKFRAIQYSQKKFIYDEKPYLYTPLKIHCQQKISIDSNARLHVAQWLYDNFGIENPDQAKEMLGPRYYYQTLLKMGFFK